ncbi:MAG TPA: hypothetical protein VHO29_09510 [Marmoricola sp.]|nr:hypothetical protein [Marmoricola sp.]
MTVQATQHEAPSRPRNVTDLVVTVVGFAVTAVLGLGASFAGLMLVMASDSCGVGSECNSGLIGAGVVFAVAAPWLCWVPGLVIAIILQSRRRLTWWLPVVAVLAYLPLAVVAFLLVNAGVRPS